MSASDGQEIGVNVRATTNGLDAGLQQAQQSVARSVGYIRENIAGLGTVVERIKIPFIELAAIMAGGAAFKEFIGKTEELGVSLLKASQQTGLTVEQLGGLKFAAEQSDVSFETLTKGLEKLSLGMQLSVQTPSATAKRALDQLGISATDSTGRLRPAGDVMADIANKFHDMQDGSGKTAIAMQIFGRAGAEMIPVLNLGGTAINKLQKDAEDLGAVMSKDGAEKAEQFHEAMGRVGLVGQALSNTIGAALMPTLTMMANAFADSAKDGGLLNAAIFLVKGAVDGVAGAFIGLETGIRIVWEIGKAMALSVADGLRGIGAALSDLGKRNFAAIGDDLKGITTSVQQHVSDMVDGIVQGAQQGSEALKKTFGIGADNSPEGPKKAAPPVVETPKSQLPEFQEQWLEIKDGQSAFAEDLLQQERAFWAKKLTEVDKGSKDYLAIHRKVAELTHQIQKQDLDDRIAQLHVEEAQAQGNGAAIVDIKRREWETIRDTEGVGSKQALAAYAAYLKASEQETERSTLRQVAIARDTSLQTIELERTKLDGLKQLGVINDTELMQRTRAIIDQEYQAKLTALNAEQALYQAGTEKYLALEDQRTQLMRGHDVAIQQNTNQTTLAIKNQWMSVFSTVTTAVQTSVNGVIQGTQTMAQALSGLARSIALDFASMEAGRLASHIATELAITQASTTGAAARSTIDWWAATQSVAASAWAGIKNITTYAATAIAATYASVAAIPFVGPFLAPALAIGIGAAVLGELGHIASAAGGYDIPSGVNPLTQLHANEMVLPASLANAVRGMAAGGGQSGAGGGGGNSAPMIVHIHAMDSQSFEQYAKRQPAAFAAGVHAAIRGGNLKQGA